MRGGRPDDLGELIIGWPLSDKIGVLKVVTLLVPKFLSLLTLHVIGLATVYTVDVWVVSVTVVTWGIDAFIILTSLIGPKSLLGDRAYKSSDPSVNDIFTCFQK